MSGLIPLPRIPRTITAVLCGGALDGKEMRVDPMFTTKELVVHTAHPNTDGVTLTPVPSKWRHDGTTDSYGRHRFQEVKT